MNGNVNEFCAIRSAGKPKRKVTQLFERFVFRKEAIAFVTGAH